MYINNGDSKSRVDGRIDNTQLVLIFREFIIDNSYFAVGVCFTFGEARNDTLYLISMDFSRCIKTTSRSELEPDRLWIRP